MRLIWLSDIHLNFLNTLADEAARMVARRVMDCRPDAVVISGDISDAPTVVPGLKALAAAVPCPVYFVLGNHDFNYGSVAAVREAVGEPLAPNLIYLPASGPIGLAPGVALVGHDGWADGRNGDFLGTPVEVNDFYLIQEFRPLATRWGRYNLMAELADEAAQYFGEVLPSVVTANRQVVLVTHVPPFVDAAFHNGRVSDPDYLPFFSNRCVGDVLREVMARHPKSQLTVLCGHTHGAGVYEAADNLVVYTASADYGRASVAGILGLSVEGIKWGTDP